MVKDAEHIDLMAPLSYKIDNSMHKMLYPHKNNLMGSDMVKSLTGKCLFGLRKRDSHKQMNY